MRITGWTTGGCSSTAFACLSAPAPFATVPRAGKPRAKSCTASSPERNDCSGFDRPSNAACMFDQIVSPPSGGSSFAYRIAPSGGVSMKVTSVCHASLSVGFCAWLSRMKSSGASGTPG